MISIRENFIMDSQLRDGTLINILNEVQCGIFTGEKDRSDNKSLMDFWFIYIKVMKGKKTQTKENKLRRKYIFSVSCQIWIFCSSNIVFLFAEYFIEIFIFQFFILLVSYEQFLLLINLLVSKARVFECFCSKWLNDENNWINWMSYR